MTCHNENYSLIETIVIKDSTKNLKHGPDATAGFSKKHPTSCL